jgi:hypothetical protein
VCRSRFRDTRLILRRSANQKSSPWETGVRAPSEVRKAASSQLGSFSIAKGM